MFDIAVRVTVLDTRVQVVAVRVRARVYIVNGKCLCVLKTVYADGSKLNKYKQGFHQTSLSYEREPMTV